MYTNIITASQLSALQSQSSNLVILDATMPPVGKMSPPSHQWPQSTIPNAIKFRLNEDFSEPESHLSHMMPTQQLFINAARKLGISNESQIVIYDSYGLFSAARAWWMFKSMGHKGVAVLDGGLPNWLALGYSVEPGKQLNSDLGNFSGQCNPRFFCDSDDVLNSIKQGSTCILDARASGRFYGTEPEPRSGMRSGHMPGALNIPYGDLLLNGKLKSITELNLILAPLIKEKRVVITSCGSGITACILALALELIGHDNTRVYDGSWSEWGANHNLPISLD